MTPLLHLFFYYMSCSLLYFFIFLRNWVFMYNIFNFNMLRCFLFSSRCFIWSSRAFICSRSYIRFFNVFTVSLFCFKFNSFNFDFSMNRNFSLVQTVSFFFNLFVSNLYWSFLLIRNFFLLFLFINIIFLFIMLFWPVMTSII